MATKQHLTPVPSDAGWTSRAEHSYDQGVSSPNEARKFSDLPVPEHKPDENGALPGHIHSVGHEATSHTAGLKLVTEDHEPQPGANREQTSTYKPPKATTSRDKLASDMGRAHSKQGIVPLGHFPPPPRIVK